MRNVVTTIVALSLVLATTGCLGMLGGSPSEPEMDEVNEDFTIQQVRFEENGPDDSSITFKPTLNKNDGDVVTLKYTLMTEDGNSSKTYYQVGETEPEHWVDLPDDVRAGESIQVLVELRDGNETVDVFLGEFSSTYSY